MKRPKNEPQKNLAAIRGRHIPADTKARLDPEWPAHIELCKRCQTRYPGLYVTARKIHGAHEDQVAATVNGRQAAMSARREALTRRIRRHA